MNRTKLERETVIIFNDEDTTATVGTTSPVVMRRLSRVLGAPKVLWEGSWSWTIDKSWVRLPRKRRKRALAPEKVQAMTEALRKGREAKKAE